MSKKKPALAALSSAAMLLNTLANTAHANPPDQKVTVDYRYTNYSEGAIDADVLAEGSAERYTIDQHQLKIKTPVADDTELSLSSVFETMSGASPWYVLPGDGGEPVQVMSGATIDESRAEISLDLRSYNTKSESTVSINHSAENDYKSFGFGYAGQWRLNHQRSNVSWGLNTSQEYIDASDADIYPGRPVEQTKSRFGGTLGFSQVMTKNRLLGINIGYLELNGYLSDPYKLAWVDSNIVQDARPDIQNNLTLKIMLREYFPKANAALHFDLQYYQNDWEMQSNTLDISWYQNLGEDWMLIPSLRFYQQNAAVFYQPYYTETRNDGYYSSDYRLSEFSAFSGRIKLARNWKKVGINILYENYSASGDHPALLSFSLLSLGITGKF